MARLLNQQYHSLLLQDAPEVATEGENAMKIVVTGATGVIGSEVVKLLSQRHEVLRCGRTTTDFAVGITSSKAIRGLFEATGTIDAVVCAAGDIDLGRWTT
jgi:nucleoside-diphosphate-sugar epimerase